LARISLLNALRQAKSQRGGQGFGKEPWLHTLQTTIDKADHARIGRLVVVVAIGLGCAGESRSVVRNAMMVVNLLPAPVPLSE
jgi:hypothetical protein